MVRNINKLKGKMAENGLTQKQLAKKVGLSDAGFRRKALYNNDFSIEESLLVKDALNLTSDEYLDIFFKDALELKTRK